MSREERIACFQDTLARCNSDELAAQTARAAAESRVYPAGFRSQRLYKVRTTEISVMEGTSFAAAGENLANGKVAVLNFANPHYPGGGVANGAMAQEECLCRSSNLYPCLDQERLKADFYGYHREHTDYFFSDRLIYTRDVTAFKDDAEIPLYLPEEQWLQVDVITCAAPYLAQRKYTNQMALREIFRSRITNILEAAIDNGAEVLILGAFGCGAFCNPPEVVAAAFWDVLTQDRYRGAFRNIVFAIKPTAENEKDCPNLAAFREVFDNPFGAIKPLKTGILPGVTLPGGRRLENAEELRRFQYWQRNNPYFGKQVSVFGDSVSTLDGFNPRGYHVHYQGENSRLTGVSEMADTWWGKVLDFYGAELLVNNSWAGSTVAVRASQTQLFPSGCSKNRTGNLHIGSIQPDVIVVNIGISDWANGIQPEPSEGQNALHFFSGAYRSMLENIVKAYPDAEVWCCTLGQTYMASNPGFRFPASYGGVDLAEYNRVIARCAGEMQCSLLDVAAQQILWDTVDGTHPTAQGMDELAAAVLLSTKNREIREFLNIPEPKETSAPVEPKKEHPKPVPIPEPAPAPKPVGLNLWLKSENRMIRLEGERHLVGRSTDCDLRLRSPYAARYQATILREGENWYLRDNNSRNGTFVNGIRLAAGENVRLKSGDTISFARMEEAEVK